MNLLHSGLCSFLSIILTLFIACGATSTGSNSESADNGVVQFKIDGKDWISGPANHPDLRYEEEATTDGRTVVRIDAFAPDGSTFSNTIYNDAGIGPGSYPISNLGMSAFFQEDASEGDGYLTNGLTDNPGSITITEMTGEKVTGVFNFSMRHAGNPTDIRHVTDGSFDLKFTPY